MIADYGIRYMLAAQALSLIACAGLWWRAAASPTLPALRRAALATALASAQGANLIAFLLLRPF
jgi:hypothetical protein